MLDKIHLITSGLYILNPEVLSATDMPEKILDKEIKKSDVVLHLAGQVAVTTSIINPRHDFEVNALGTLNILESIRKISSKKKPVLIYASTNKVYGDLVEIKVSER